MARLTMRNSDGTVSQPTKTTVEDVFYRLAYYEDMEEQGRLVVLPCKVGDTIWMIVTKRQKDKPDYSFIKRSYLTWPNMFRVLRDFGKTVFLTRELAEQALATDKNDGRKNGGAN